MNYMLNEFCKIICEHFFYFLFFYYYLTLFQTNFDMTNVHNELKKKKKKKKKKRQFAVNTWLWFS